MWKKEDNRMTKNKIIKSNRPPSGIILSGASAGATANGPGLGLNLGVSG